MVTMVCLWLTYYTREKFSLLQYTIQSKNIDRMYKPLVKPKINEPQPDTRFLNVFLSVFIFIKI